MLHQRGRQKGIWIWGRGQGRGWVGGSMYNIDTLYNKGCFRQRITLQKLSCRPASYFPAKFLFPAERAVIALKTTAASISSLLISSHYYPGFQDFLTFLSRIPNPQASSSPPSMASSLSWSILSIKCLRSKNNKSSLEDPETLYYNTYMDFCF